jgi:hypothetical protein
MSPQGMALRRCADGRMKNLSTAPYGRGSVDSW